MYDVSGRQDLAAALNDPSGPGAGAAAGAGVSGDETLNSVLYAVFCEFLDGDFEMIRVLVSEWLLPLLLLGQTHLTDRAASEKKQTQ